MFCGIAIIDMQKVPVLINYYRPTYLSTTHSLSAVRPRWAQSQQYAKGQSARQGQIYTLSSHHLHFYLHYCSGSVLKTHSHTSKYSVGVPLLIIQLEMLV